MRGRFGKLCDHDRGTRVDGRHALGHYGGRAPARWRHRAFEVAQEALADQDQGDHGAIAKWLEAVVKVLTAKDRDDRDHGAPERASDKAPGPERKTARRPKSHLAQLLFSPGNDQSRHHTHHKYAVFDRATVVTGSYNWTRSAAKHNWEQIAVANDPKHVRQFTDGFTEIRNDLAPRGSR